MLRGLKHVCPSSGVVYADKGYSIKPAQDIAKIKGVYLPAIKASSAGNICGKSVFLSQHLSISKKCALGICACKYLSYAFIFVLDF